MKESKDTSMDGVCKNCLKLTRLERSHAIPNSFFKPLARGGNGQFIELTDGPSRARRSQDSGQDFLLCSRCERLFGDAFDGPISEEFRNIRSSFLRDKKIFVRNPDQIKSSIASIIWRASVSKANIYSRFIIPNNLQDMLTHELWDANAKARRFSYSAWPIYDSTPVEEGGFGDKVVESLVMTPKPWITHHGFSGRSHSGWGAIFVVLGIVVTIVYPRLSPYKERQNAYLLSTGRTSRVKPMDMWSVPYLRDFLSYAVYKEKAPAIHNVAS